MASVNNFMGVWLTIQYVRTHWDCSLIEFIVLDNFPDLPPPDPKRKATISEQVRKFIEVDVNGHDCWGARYIPDGAVHGTSYARNKAIAAASGEIVLCCDDHVWLIHPQAIPRLIQWFDDRPGCMDLVSGPTYFDNLLSPPATQFNDEWRSQMWGTWGSAFKAPCDASETFSAIKGPTGQAVYITLEMRPQVLTETKCGPLPIAEFENHKETLLGLGYRALGNNQDGDPLPWQRGDGEFEIPGMGLGVFAFRKESWLGFNEHATGFGGEELYIHEKYRQAGRQCWCLEFLPWLHCYYREGRAGSNRWEKIRNYVNESVEIGQPPLEQIHEHFVLAKPKPLMNQLEWNALVADPTALKPPPEVIDQVKSMHAQATDAQKLEQMYGAVCAQHRDLEKHLPKLRELASKCDYVIEHSKRGETAVAIAAAQPKRFYSWNREADRDLLSALRTVSPHVISTIPRTTLRRTWCSFTSITLPSRSSTT